jgi:carboxymethylenebutenolidase
MHADRTLPLTALLAAAPLLVAACGGGSSYGDRMSREHQGDKPVPAAATEEARQTAEPPASELVSQRVVYATLDGREVTGYLARPADHPTGLPGIIVIHEWWGLNDNVETMARMLARPGYAALAVDLYGGKAAEDADGARTLMGAVQPAAAEANLRQAHDYLTDQLKAPRVGVLGWCFGGGWSLKTALLLPDQIDAAVIYYGHLETDRDRLATLKMPILGLFGAEDQGIPVAQVREFEATLKALGKDADIRIYDGAGHAFANPSGTRYQPEAAKDAWERTLAFLAKNLKG